MSNGVLAAAFAYILWGIFPLYIKQVAEVPALEIVAHRSVWCLVFMLALLAVLRRFAWLREVVRQPRTLGIFTLSALLLSGNWLIYVWAVNHDRVLDASLGYFINPLVNVMLGYLVLHERPRAGQWAAVALAALGVVWLALGAGALPWISLVLAATFGCYGLLRKTAPLGAIEGLTLETLMLAPLTIALLLWFALAGPGRFAQGDWAVDGWLLLAGPFTAIPLLLFAYGARRVTLATLGLLQYLGPSIQFLLGVFVYHEPFDPARGVGFALIWAALVVYSGESLWRMRRDASAASAAPT
ncbi:EamA family transporter RarD [Aquincola sp. S2]|uniref:EamA family transporter RarD n=1 Tax=Pseudaquabacterium terrae TaxID=2732868 RepID=A0ABX2EG35_9BURK|nr:EamA family transporter RarD [Aquabacterium terrae]NRF67551.1 EamA family transporter RarD [Aquabacterium terrae]